jgi:hypothetical protein
MRSLDHLNLKKRFVIETFSVEPNHVTVHARRWTNLIFLALVFLAGCYKQPGAGQIPPFDILSFSKEQLEDIRKRDFAHVESNLYPTLKPENIRTVLESVAGVFPIGEPKDTKLIAFFENKRNAATDLAFEYEYDHKWLLARISTIKTNNNMFVCGVFVNPVNMPVDQMIAMRWSKHGPIYYLFLVLAIIEPVFILAVIAMCVRAPNLKRKWLWLFAVAFGWMQLTLNWHTGGWKVNPFGFQFLGSGYFAPMQYSPIIWPLFLTISLPVGAIVFPWKRYRNLENRSAFSQSMSGVIDEADNDRT